MSTALKPEKKSILAINAGSSSLKFALFGEALQRIQYGGIDSIGQPGATLTLGGLKKGDAVTRLVAAPDHLTALGVIMNAMAEDLARSPLAGAGHRIVHGGPTYYAPQRIDSEMISALRDASAFDPEHLPPELALIEAFQQRFSNLPQIACFDTAFHHDLPRIARQLPIPRRYEAKGIRRYGFHGLSCTYLLSELARLDGVEAARGKVVVAHLGSGASLTAVHWGKSVDTSMSFTPASGVPMSSRSGDLDPGLMSYLGRTEQMTPDEFSEMVNFKSGLLGISETSGDMAQLLSCEADDSRAAEAVALFCYQVRKGIGAFAAALGGLDTLIFAGGIGENAPVVRARICQDLGFLGVDLDQARNAVTAPIISADAGKVRVRVIHTDEEQVIARSVARLLDLKPMHVDQSA